MALAYLDETIPVESEQNDSITEATGPDSRNNIHAHPKYRRLFNNLVKRYYADMYRYAFWLCKDPTIAEDVLQETFLRAWKSIDSLEEIDAAQSWLNTILRRENLRRFERKQFNLVEIEENTTCDDSASADTVVLHQQLQRRILALESDYRDPLLLHVKYGLSGNEISSALDINRNTVLTRLFRARNKLKLEFSA